jgi:hypothetical protein
MLEVMARGLLIEHRHDDGTWASLEPDASHDSAAHDAEREWLRGKVYRCTRCDEQVRVSIEPEEDQPA